MSDLKPQPNVAFLVMPPGHGKSVRHSELEGIIEADTLVPCNGTPGLRTLRVEAKRTGNWVSYDMLWTRMLAESLKQYTIPVILLVPSAQVGYYGGWVDLGGLLLTEHTWRDNFQNRADSHYKWISCWNDEWSRGGVVCETNQELSKQLSSRYDFWKDTLTNHAFSQDA